MIEIEKKWWWILGAAFALVVGVVVFRSGPGVQGYVRGEKAVAEWRAAAQDEGLYRQMEVALKGAPDLRDKYGAMVAQGLIQVGRAAEAEKMVVGPLARLKEEAPLYAEFGEVSLLVERGEWQEALERSVALKGRAKGAVLYGYNLLRIAFLQKALGNGPGEKAAWDEVERFAESENGAWMKDHFRYKKVDFQGFIGAERGH